MKFYTSIVAILLSCLLGNAQAQEALFTPTSATKSLNEKVDKAVKNISWFLVDQGQLARLYQEKSPQFTLKVSYQGKPINIVLKGVNREGANYTVLLNSKEKFTKPFNEVIHYQGFIEGESRSLAAFSFTEKQVWGLVAYKNHNLNFIMVQDEKRTLLAVYNDWDVELDNPFECHADDLHFNKMKEGIKRSLNPDMQKGGTDNCRRVEIRFDLDYQMYVDNGSSVPNTLNFFNAMFNMVAVLFDREGIRIVVSEVSIATQQDSWPTANSFEVLDAYQTFIGNLPSFDGNLAHLLSTRQLAHGGVAYLGVLCQPDFNIAYSNINNSFSPIPIYSWTINVIAHELGHNFGSPHTQSCDWEISPGVSGMIDSCFTPEGSCYQGPRIPKVGTTMSYCHLTAGIDLSVGFGPLPGALIEDEYNFATCLDGSVVLNGLTVSQDAVLCDGSTFSPSISVVQGATYNWTGPNQFSSTQRNPSITNITQANSGVYAVTVTLNNCTSVQYFTRLSVDCHKIELLPDISICQGARFNVPIKSNANVQAGNSFIVELSNANGSFTNPISIGSLSSSSTQASIPVQVSTAIAPGNAYRVRVRSTNPARAGQPYPLQLSVNTSPAAPIVADQNRCSPGTVTFNASGGNSVVQWFADSITNTPISVGNSFTTPVLNSTRAYWVGTQVQTQRNLGPEDPNVFDEPVFSPSFNHGMYVRVFKDVRIDSVTVFANGPGSVMFRVRDSASTFTIQSVSRQVIGTGTAIKIAIGLVLTPGIYRVDATGTTVESLVRNEFGAVFPFVVPNILSIESSTAGTRYNYFYNWKVTGLDCPSLRRKVFAIIGSGGVASPTVQGANRCGTGSVTLSASGATGTNTYRWYTLPSGGSPIPNQTSGTYATPSISNTTSYYVSILGANNCESSRIMVTATINTIPSNPTTTSAARCGSGTVTLQAAGAQGTQTYRWYTVQTGGTPIANQTGASYTTPSLTATTVYYVSVLGTGNCESGRVAVTASINPLPTNPTTTSAARCGSGTVTLQAAGAQGTQTYRWYTTQTGGTPIANQTGASSTTPSLNATTVYYVSVLGTGNCESGRVAVTATINPLPTNPTTTSAARCGSGTVTLQAAGAQGTQTYRWYTVQTGGTPIANQTGASYTTPSLTATTVYYVSVLGTGNCESNRVAVNATINAIPNSPTASSVSRCGPGLVTMQANGALANETYRWYTVPSGGIAIPGQTSSSYSTNVTTNTIYYVSINGIGNCESGRSQLQVNINPLPILPIVQVARPCLGDSANLQVSNIQQGVVYQWFGPNQDSLVGANSSLYTTPPIIQDQTYYVRARSAQGCGTVLIPAFISPLPRPSAPQVSDSGRCGPGQVLLSVNNVNGRFRWYSGRQSIDSLSNQANRQFTTPTLNTSQTYFVAAVGVNGCESRPRVAVSAIIRAVPPTPVLRVENGFIIANVDTQYVWTRNGSVIAHNGDSLDLTTYGPGIYVATILRGNGCSSSSEPLAITSLEEKRSILDACILVPNPGNDFVNILGAPEGVEIVVFNTMGKSIFEGKQIEQIDVRNWPVGTYVFMLKHENKLRPVFWMKQ